MFAQVISGKAADPDAMARQQEKWRNDLRPGAAGFINATGGVTADGRFQLVALFDSPESAKVNSDRPEQGEWWAETEPLLSDVEFAESTDVIFMGDGVSPSAGFVQIMNGRVLDEGAYEAMLTGMRESTAAMKEFRPDVLGSLTVRHSGDRFADLIYFTNEAEARSGEAREMPPELAAEFEAMTSAVSVDEYVDLTTPWID